MIEITLLKISDIKPNPNNPRIIKDDKFLKLVNSIKEFPEMLRIRPIVINEHNIVLGGNMRLKACLEAKLKEVPVIVASDLTEAQQKEFIIKDNVGFGEWDWDNLANEWETNDLASWGMDVWRIPDNPGAEDPEEITDNMSNTDRYKNTDEFAMDYLNSDMKKFEIFIEKKDYDEVLFKLNKLKVDKAFKNNSEAISWLILNH
jgi:hypothetical protein